MEDRVNGSTAIVSGGDSAARKQSWRNNTTSPSKVGVLDALESE
jgi:hypothetical protein